jgi:SAM-dependent methyltransferase
VAESDSEVPGSVDFNDPTQVHDWIMQTVQRRAWRPRIFAAIARALNDTFDRAIDVVELGSGAGHLAREILHNCRIASYAAIDVSPAIHDAARAQLGDAAHLVRFVVGDSLAGDWSGALTPVDAVLAMPTARELAPREPPFRRIHAILRPDGLLLCCNQYDHGGLRDPATMLRREELRETLRATGFRRVEELLELGSMVLVRAVA